MLIILENNTKRKKMEVKKCAVNGFFSGLRLIGGTLFVADANYGIYSVNIKNGEIFLLVTPDIIEPNLKFVDDLSITSDGNYIYFSDGSAKHSLDGLLNIFLEGISKRIVSPLISRMSTLNFYTEQDWPVPRN